MPASSKNIQVRGVPEPLHSELSRQAEEEGLSLNRYLLREFERMARRSRNAEILHRAAGRPGRRAASEQIVQSVRDDREGSA
jgi:hypothetical protein